MKKTGRMILCILVVALSLDTTFAQQPGSTPHESHTFRIAFTVGGAAGGAFIGFFTGMTAFDDSTNSERKITMTTALAGAGGGIGGYFLGRMFDKSRKKTVRALPYDWERTPGTAANRYSLIDSSHVFRTTFGETNPASVAATSVRYTRVPRFMIRLTDEDHAEIKRTEN